MVKLLVYSEADVNAEPAYSCGREALQGAAKNGNLVVMKLPLSHGASNHVFWSNINGVIVLNAVAGRGAIYGQTL